MSDEVKEQSTTSETQDSTAITVVNTENLNKEAVQIINQVISETDITKTGDLTELFNLNQKKKTMVRVNKLNDLLDKITDQAIERFSKKPDEISNQELLQGLKVVQDSLERGQNQINSQANTPLIQINQQTNEVNVGTPETMSKESRDKIKNAVASILAGVVKQQPQAKSEIIDVDVEEVKSEESKNE